MYSICVKGLQGPVRGIGGPGIGMMQPGYGMPPGMPGMPPRQPGPGGISCFFKMIIYILFQDFNESGWNRRSLLFSIIVSFFVNAEY